jgi:ATP-dependent Zn protease
MRHQKGHDASGNKERGGQITFADVAGVDEAKEELEEIVVCSHEASHVHLFDRTQQHI